MSVLCCSLWFLQFFGKKLYLHLVWLPELGDSSQTLSRPSDRKTQQDSETDQDRRCPRPPPGCSWSSWRTAGTGWERGRYYNWHSPLIPTIQQMPCFSYFRDSGLISRSSFSPGDGHGSVHTARRSHIADCFRRAAMSMILTALSLPG